MQPQELQLEQVLQLEQPVQGQALALWQPALALQHAAHHQAQVLQLGPQQVQVLELALQLGL